MKNISWCFLIAFLTLVCIPARALTDKDIENFAAKLESDREVAKQRARRSIKLLDSESSAGMSAGNRAQRFLNAAVNLMQAGEWPEAEYACRQALALSRRPDVNAQVQFLASAGNLVRILFSQARVEEAEVLLDETRNVVEKMSDRHDLQGTSFLILQAELFLAKGKMEKFDNALAEIINIVDTKYVNLSYANYKIVAIDLSVLMLKAGKLKELILFYEKADKKYLSDFPHGMNLDEIWAGRIGRAQILTRIGEDQEAEALLAGAEKESNLRDGMRGTILTFQGAAELRKKNYDMAIQLYLRAAKLSENIKSPTNIAIGSYLNVAYMYFEKGEIEKFNEYLDKAINALNINPGINPTAIQQSYTQIAQLLLKQDRIATAKDYLNKALLLARYNTIGGVGATYQVYQILFDIAGRENNTDALIDSEGHIYKAISNPVISRQLMGTARGVESNAFDSMYLLYRYDSNLYFERSWEYAQTLGAPSIEGTFIRSINRVNIGSSTVRDLIREKQYLQMQLEKIQVGNEYGKKVANDIQNKLLSIEGELFKEMPGYDGLIDSRPASSQQLKSVLKKNEAIVQFLSGKDSYYAWVISPTQSTMVRLEGSPSLIRKEIGLLRDSLNPDDAGQLPEYAGNVAHDLYVQLFSPIMKAIGTVSHVFLVPDPAMLAIPFPALILNNDGGESPKWLANRFSLSILPSAKSLMYIRAAKPVTAKKPFVGFGDPLLGSKALTRQPISGRGLFFGFGANPKAIAQLPSLPETREEILSIARSLGSTGSSVFLGEKATEENVKLLPLTKYKVIAFATHGLLSGDISGITEPGLVLTPPKQATELDDGVLTASEILSIKMDADWVILSACNTGLGDGGAASEGLTGLAKSFIFSGARSLLVSSWPVNSMAATELTTKTFQRIAANRKITKAEALRQTMMSMSQSQEVERRHPFYWAPFSLVGAIN